MMDPYVLDFREIDQHRIMLVGGKGANLGELYRLDGIRVPEGFCVTTEAYKRALSTTPEIKVVMDQLSRLTIEDREKIREISVRIRKAITETVMGDEIKQAIADHLSKLGEANAYAVRSSATAEDLPAASFAGLQDTYLNIKGADAVVSAVRKCWASLFTDRAVTYRIRNGFDHSQVYLAVVIQRMIFPRAAGIMFTADPVTSNRKVLSIDAGFGLGEALVSGVVNADNYKVRDGIIVHKQVAVKKSAIYALEEGGTEQRELKPEMQHRQTLTDGQILMLEGLGRKIEAFFGCPQDIEWCLGEDVVFTIQSRPITTLYPIPENDGQNRIYASIGHQQMMTDAIKPLGMGFFQPLFDRAPLCQAGGRLFLDLTHDLTAPVGRKIILKIWGESDPAMRNALMSLFKRKTFMKSLARGKRYIKFGSAGLSWVLLTQAIKVYFRNDVGIVHQLISRNEESVKILRQNIGNRSGDDLFAFIMREHRQFIKNLYGSPSMGVIVAGMYALNWINKHMEKWLGEKNSAAVLSQSVANNVTSEMGLALLDVSDVVRQYPAVIEYFQHANEATFFADLAQLDGGQTVVHTLRAYLDKYGMRCSGEIDITRPRWSEKPTALIPLILNNINNFAPDSSSVKFEQGRLEAGQKEAELLKRLNQLAGGHQKAEKTRRMISVLRNCIGYREYPKYSLIQRYWIYKQALLKEASKLVLNKVIAEKEDCYYLTFNEFREAVRGNRPDYKLIVKRKEEYEVYDKLTPPRILTSEGECLFGSYNIGSNIPSGALPGIPVSSGVVEGRARVAIKLEYATIEPGDILVTTFTDPSWTPIFVSAKGLVTEVGGMMTHGAVIAREYGLPAVVGVDRATQLIKDGQRIRIDGSEGYVEILSP
jgi:phosphoenolpyruvate synthase/pyruvate phosphate dikinase